jgi:anaerobic selenocysteine-containing dehydrogenase
MYNWDSPLRIRKPLKRVGERGQGRFEEISWEQALNEIAAKLKTVVEANGARSVAFTTKDLLTPLHWIAWPLGSPNVVQHHSTCNTAGVVARRWMMGEAFGAASIVDPDYDHLRYLLLPGRVLSAPMGVVHRLAKARKHGAQVVFLNPAMPEAAFADSEWLACYPGTDAAFMLGLCQVLISENRIDRGFLSRFSNLPFLIRPDGKPLTEADLRVGGKAERFAIRHNGKLAYHDDAGVSGDLEYTGDVTLADGRRIRVSTAFNRFVKHLEGYKPERVAEITRLPADVVVRIARELHTMQGVVEDTWYNTRNGNDTDAVMALMTVNALLGNFDRPGGLCFRPGARLPAPITLDGEGNVTTIMGDSFLMKDIRRIDSIKYPETNGTFDAVLEAILTGEPYPIKALFIVGSTIFQRDSNTKRVEEALKKLDLIVTNEILAQEHTDWSDYVLPVEMYLERGDLRSISWTMTASVSLQERVTTPPPGVDARPDLWILLEILRRAYPERAAMVGYFEPFADIDTFRREFARPIRDRILEGLARAWNLDLTTLTKELQNQGFKILQGQRYYQVPYVRGFDTPSGRLEIYALRPVLRGFRRHGFAEYFEPPAFTAPREANEFVLVNGKNLFSGSGTSGLSFPARFLSTRAVWVHPDDAERLMLADGDSIEVEGLDTGWRAGAQVRVTPRVRPGVLFVNSYSGGYRQRKVAEDERFRFLSQGLNPHWFTKGHFEPVTGAGANNASVRIRKV